MDFIALTTYEKLTINDSEIARSCVQIRATRRRMMIWFYAGTSFFRQRAPAPIRLVKPNSAYKVVWLVEIEPQGTENLVY